jgi:thiamine kinase-like enzyme
MRVEPPRSNLKNILWSGDQVVGLIDFEFAVMAPEILDLSQLVHLAFEPVEHLDIRRTWLQKVVIESAAPLLVQPEARDLLFGYTILHATWLMDDWLAHPEGEGPLENWQPLRRLVALADGDGGYLAALVN